MKKQRLSLAEDVAISQRSTIQGMEVFRPLLNVYKHELTEYCKKNQVEFGIDETNFDRRYRRNAIRMDHLDHLSLEAMEKLYQEAKDEQNQREAFLMRIRNYYQVVVKKGSFPVTALYELNEEERRQFLYELVTRHRLKAKSKISKRFLDNLSMSLMVDKAHVDMRFGKRQLVKSYGQVHIRKDLPYQEYRYELKAPGRLITPYFTLNHRGGEEIAVLEEDFPLTIRNYRAKDRLVLSQGHKPLRRFFIDKKVPLYLRKIMPLLINKEGEILFIPHLYKNKDRNLLQSRRIVLKLKSLIEA
jgi:tRNA(Ile)-lysidine synthase